MVKKELDGIGWAAFPASGWRAEQMNRFWTGLTLAGAVALLGGVARAQTTTVSEYFYDFLGRTTQVDRLTGVHQRYIYDPAGNRTEAFFANFSTAPLNWEAESLNHNVGYADGDAWVGGLYSGSGLLTYGPYATFSAGSHAAGWRMAIDDTSTQDGYIQVEMQVYDATTNGILGSYRMNRQGWPSAGQYYYFAVPFYVDPSHTSDQIEFRTVFYAHGNVRVDKIRVN